VLGLSNVFTFPPYRNEGHASQLVTAAGQQIDNSGADLAILFCESALEPFYSAHGW
jgi:predicted acetyltransferase